MILRFRLPSLPFAAGLCAISLAALAAAGNASAQGAAETAAKPAAAATAPAGSPATATQAPAAASAAGAPGSDSAQAVPAQTGPKVRKKSKAATVAASGQPAVASPAAAASATAAPTKAGKGPGAVVITVGPNKIRRSQIESLVEQMKKANPNPRKLDDRQETAMAAMIATNLIGQELLDLESKRLAVEATPAEIDSMYKQLRASFPDEATWKRALKEGGNTEAGFREKLARQIKADKILNKQIPQVERPTYKEIIDYHAAHKKTLPVDDSLRACQIVLLAGKDAKAADADRKKAELEKLRAELAKDSTDPDKLLMRFMLAARQAGEGPERNDGGDLQRFHPGDFSPELKKQVTALRVGQLSPVFRSPMGWHLLLLTEKHDGKPDSYRYLIGRAIAGEKAAAAGQTLRKYLQGLATRYKVNYLESAYRDTSPTGVYNL